MRANDLGLMSYTALYLILLLFFCSFCFVFSFTLYKCQYRKNELLALELAKKENIAEIVDFYGVKIKGRNACIFMEFMAGKDKRMYNRLFFLSIIVIKLSGMKKGCPIPFLPSPSSSRSALIK